MDQIPIPAPVQTEQKPIQKKPTEQKTKEKKITQANKVDKFSPVLKKGLPKQASAEKEKPLPDSTKPISVEDSKAKPPETEADVIEFMQQLQNDSNSSSASSHSLQPSTNTVPMDESAKGLNSGNKSDKLPFPVSACACASARPTRFKL